jgi:hypothetical protein
MKSLYDLIHSPKAWYEKIGHFLFNLGFKHCESEHNIYVFHVNGETLIVTLYVDDLVIIGINANLILGLKKRLEDTFEMIYLGILHLFLGIQVLQMYDSIFIYQANYALNILHKFIKEDYRPYATPYQYGVKLTNECDSFNVDATLYQ